MASFSIPLTSEQVQKLAPEFGPSGTLPETDGVSLGYRVTGGMVTFDVIKKPFYVSIGQIEHHVRGLLGL